MLQFTDYLKFLVALTFIVNPISALPMFISLTVGNTETEKREIARVAALAVVAVLVCAALIGEPVLGLFGITIASFKVGGAIIILLIAISMVHAAPNREKKQTPAEAREAAEKDNIAVVPLAIPLLAGPGAISTTIVYATERHSVAHLAIILGCCALVGLATWVALRLATPVAQWLGETGLNIAVRLMGLLLAAVAVEIFASGLVVLLPGLK